MNELPIEIECFLLTQGFFKAGQEPGKQSTPGSKPVQVQPTGWMPSHKGEDPPF